MKYQIVPTANMMSIKRRHQRQQNLEDHDVGQRHPSQRSLARKHSAMLVHGLQNSERPAKTLAHQAIRIGRRLGVGQRHVFVFDAITAAQQRHRQIGIFRDRIDVVAAGLAHRRNAPRTNRSGHHADRAQHVERTALEVLAGDVFERLPARPQIHAVADLGVARDRTNFRIDEVRHQARNRVGCDDRVGVNADKKLRVANVLDPVVRAPRPCRSSASPGSEPCPMLPLL